MGALLLSVRIFGGQGKYGSRVDLISSILPLSDANRLPLTSRPSLLPLAVDGSPLCVAVMLEAGYEAFENILACETANVPIAALVTARMAQR